MISICINDAKFKTVSLQALWADLLQIWCVGITTCHRVTPLIITCIGLTQNQHAARVFLNPLNPAPDFIGMCHLSGGLTNRLRTKLYTSSCARFLHPVFRVFAITATLLSLRQAAPPVYLGPPKRLAYPVESVPESLQSQGPRIPESDTPQGL